MAEEKAVKLSLFALTTMVIGSMVGAGIFNLPGRFANATGSLGSAIAWAVAGTGTYMLARVFQTLAERRPDLDAGIYAYAKAGFGSYSGFLSAFGYWLAGCLGNVFFWVLIGSTLGRFFPGIFGGGNTRYTILFSLAGVWSFHFTILRGVEQAAFINQIVTVAKIVPLLVSVLVMVCLFDKAQFEANFWGGTLAATKSLPEQLRETMLITVFVFLGIEGASVYSRYARTRAHVGRATLLGFGAVLSLMVLVTLLPYAVAPGDAIAGAGNPSLAGVMGLVVGPWGMRFVSAGVLISVLGCYLAWTLICAEVLFTAAKMGDMPRIFAGQNAKRVPASALWLTNCVVSLFILSTYWSKDAFNVVLDMTSVSTLLPYLLVAGYGLQLARSGAGYEDEATRQRRDVLISTAAVIYVFFLYLTAGLAYVLLTAALYLPGTVLYFWARHEQGARLFNGAEIVVFIAIFVASLAGIWGVMHGTIAI